MEGPDLEASQILLQFQQRPIPRAPVPKGAVVERPKRTPAEFLALYHAAEDKSRLQPWTVAEFHELKAANSNGRTSPPKDVIRYQPFQDLLDLEAPESELNCDAPTTAQLARDLEKCVIAVDSRNPPSKRGPRGMTVALSEFHRLRGLRNQTRQDSGQQKAPGKPDPSMRATRSGALYGGEYPVSNDRQLPKPVPKKAISQQHDISPAPQVPATKATISRSALTAAQASKLFLKPKVKAAPKTDSATAIGVGMSAALQIGRRLEVRKNEDRFLREQAPPVTRSAPAADRPKSRKTFVLFCNRSGDSRKLENRHLSAAEGQPPPTKPLVASRPQNAAAARENYSGLKTDRRPESRKVGPRTSGADKPQLPTLPNPAPEKNVAPLKMKPTDKDREMSLRQRSEARRFGPEFIGFMPRIPPDGQQDTGPMGDPMTPLESRAGKTIIYQKQQESPETEEPPWYVQLTSKTSSIVLNQSSTDCKSSPGRGGPWQESNPKYSKPIEGKGHQKSWSVFGPGIPNHNTSGLERGREPRDPPPPRRRPENNDSRMLIEARIAQSKASAAILGGDVPQAIQNPVQDKSKDTFTSVLTQLKFEKRAPRITSHSKEPEAPPFEASLQANPMERGNPKRESKMWNHSLEIPPESARRGRQPEDSPVPTPLRMGRGGTSPAPQISSRRRKREPPGYLPHSPPARPRHQEPAESQPPTPRKNEPQHSNTPRGTSTDTTQALSEARHPHRRFFPTHSDPLDYGDDPVLIAPERKRRRKTSHRAASPQHQNPSAVHAPVAWHERGDPRPQPETRLWNEPADNWRSANRLGRRQISSFPPHRRPRSPPPPVHGPQYDDQRRSDWQHGERDGGYRQGQGSHPKALDPRPAGVTKARHDDGPDRFGGRQRIWSPGVERDDRVERGGTDMHGRDGRSGGGNHGRVEMNDRVRLGSPKGNGRVGGGRNYVDNRGRWASDERRERW